MTFSVSFGADAEAVRQFGHAALIAAALLAAWLGTKLFDRPDPDPTDEPREESQT